MGRLGEGVRPLPRLGSDGDGHEVDRSEINQRREQVNDVLRAHDLAHPFTHVGDVNKGEIAVLRAGEVIRLGHRGLNLVELPVQFTPDKRDPVTGKETPGATGKFWTFFESRDGAAQDQIVIPFVIDAPRGSGTPSDFPRSSTTVNDINHQLAELHLKGLPFPVDEPRERVTGIAEVVNVNKNYFTVVVFETAGHIERPIVYNAASDTGIDGSVFAATIRKAEYGGEPRLIIGPNYRLTTGKSPEVPRGFYSPDAELAKVRGLTDTDIPAVNRAIDEFNTETGIADPRLRLVSLGKTMQDPVFEASTPSFYKIDMQDPEYSAQQIEDAEKYTVDLLTYGQFFGNIPGIQDAFTLTAIVRSLARSGILGVSNMGRRAQDNGEQMVLGRPYRFQHGVHTTEVFRTSTEGMPVDESVGTVAVNSGIARILPNVHIGSTSWEDIRRAGQAKELPEPQLLYPQEALYRIANGEFDVVTTAAIVKALHAKNYLTLDFRNPI